jgi:3-phenylpropionate/trans-cinnamate dioxygenase ferredoxin subunit
MSDFINVGPVSNFPPNQTTAVKMGDVEMCVANCNGAFTAFDDSCTHAHALLSGSDIEDGCEVMCPLHGARFNVQTGAALTLPAVKPLRMHQIKVENGAVFIKLNDNH